jgi:outer membrane murein-binding lipoprotein Lpp
MAGAVAAFLSAPVFAQSVDAARLEEIARQLQELRAQNDRLQAEVEYLKANAREERKQLASDELTLGNLNSTAAVAGSRYIWSSDFRFRHEMNNAEENATSRNRERIRVRFGVAARVNDTINAKLQLSTINAGNDSPRSLNQTLGTTWDRKTVGFDQAYVDWKFSPTGNLVLGKMPIPFVTTVSYQWDKDLTPEGVALKYVRGPLFAGGYYFALNERDVAASSLASKDADIYAAQVGFRKVIGNVTWTGAVGYFDFIGVKDRIANGANTGCTVDGAFGAGQGSGNNASGNTLYSGGALLTTGSGTSCGRLLNDYNLIEVLGQADFNAGRYPVSIYFDYVRNNGVVASQVNRQDTGYSAGFLFNKAGGARTWEVGYVYQKTEKDALFAQFHDSDFSGGLTDSSGSVIKLAYVPATSWTLNVQYMLNARFIDNGDSAPTKDYKRLQVDLNYKY